MKRGWAWLWMWVGVLSLLWFLHPFRCLRHHRPVAEDRAVLGPSEFVFAWRTAAPAASTPPAWSRAGPRESFALHSEFLTTHDVGPLWLDHRGSPRPPGFRHLLVTRCKARAGGQRRERTEQISDEIPGLQRANPNSGFFNSLELGREPVGSPSDKPIHTAVYALIRDFQAIPDAGPIFVGGDERLYRAGFAPGLSRI